MSTCWKVWHGGRDPPAENEKAFRRLREKARDSKQYACVGLVAARCCRGGYEPLCPPLYLVHWVEE